MNRFSNFFSRNYVKILSTGILMTSLNIVNETTYLFYPQRLREAANVEMVYTKAVQEIDSRLKGIEAYLNEPVYSRLDAFNKPVLRLSAVDDSLTVQYSLMKQKDDIKFRRGLAGGIAEDIRDLHDFNKNMRALNVTFLGLSAICIVGGIMGALYGLDRRSLGQTQLESEGGYHHG
ncbi:hypothetical protein HYT56_03760 [Candidatus Woesearchaeota archaeon]|nr:hypothetical protein [Candidatus Woesearchaeota archaeon]